MAGTSKAVFGVCMFDISSDKGRTAMWDELAGKVIRSTNSCMIFDWKFQPEVLATLRRNANLNTDTVYEPQRFNQEDAQKTREWVQTAMQTFHDEVISRFKQTVSRAEKQCEDVEIGVLDVLDRQKASKKRIKRAVDTFYIAAATFRMGDEFLEFKKMIDIAMEAEDERVAMVVANNADRLAEEVKKRKTVKKKDVVERSQQHA